jgi:hypothetical protein
MNLIMTTKNQQSLSISTLFIISGLMIATGSFAQTNTSDNHITTSNMENTNGYHHYIKR